MIMASQNNGRKIGYLLKTYPKVSETFILHEILALEQQGMALHIFSLNRPSDAKFHTITNDVRARVTYVTSSIFKNTTSLFIAHLELFLGNPKRYWRVLRFLFSRKEGNRFKEFCQAGLLSRAIKKLGIVHLHAHFASDPTGVAELVCLLVGTNYSFTAHAKDIYLSIPEVLKRKIRRAKFVITCTGYNQQFLQTVSLKSTPVYRVYHGLDTQRFQAVNSGESLNLEKTHTILSVGRFREKKGFSYLIHACRLIQERGYKFQCNIVGYGPLQAEIKQLISDFRLDEVVSLIGKLTQDDLIELYRRSTIFVLPCQIADDGDRDGIPNVLLEAMAMQLPVVSTDVSGISELVDHMKNGILVPQKDSGSLASAMALLLDRPILRQEFGKAGREKVLKQFSSEQNIEKVKELLNGCIT